MSVSVAALLLAPSMVAASATPSQDMLASQVAVACRATAPAKPEIEGLDVQPMPADAGDLPYLLITDIRTHATAKLLYEPGFGALAEAKAACWGGQLALLAPALPDTRTGIEWAPLVFTADKDYIPPRETREVRWSAVVSSDEAAFDRFLTVTMPHEEVHHSQKARRTGLPRWFQEGHAEWSALQVTDAVRLDLAAAERAKLANAASRLLDPKLGAWGGIKVKPEAIRRQLSPADQARLDSDPNFTPTGPFKFDSDDFISDEDDMPGRYGAALALFDGLEDRHGKAAVRAWINDVLGADKVSIPELAKARLGEDISPLLK